MSNTNTFQIAVFPGDGIGEEVMAACLAVLAALQERVGGFRLVTEVLPGGAALYRDTGTALSDEHFRKAEAADAILFGAMGLPDVRYPDGTEIAPHLVMRREFGLYAGVRPVKSFANSRTALADPRAAEIDLVILRESTEGLFASHGKGVVEDDMVARETLVITRPTCERLFDFACRLAMRRKERGGKGRVTCVDKANVFASMAFFRKIFDERTRNFPALGADHHYVDAMALDLVRKPWTFDVLVMENMFGDILSDLGAALVGGMGMAPCGEIGDRARPVPAGARLGARHRRHRPGQSDRDAALCGPDAGLARPAARRADLHRSGHAPGGRDRPRLSVRRDPADRTGRRSDHHRGRPGPDRPALASTQPRPRSERTRKNHGRLSHVADPSRHIFGKPS